MNFQNTYLTQSILVATCLALGAIGCGDDGGGPTVNSNLPGVYRVDLYQLTPTDPEDPDVCDKLSDSDPQPDFLVLYSFVPNDEPDEPRLGGIFCSDVEACREIARDAPEPVFGYSFLTGNDSSGWLGWGVQDSGLLNDQCKVDMQTHTLLSMAEAIDIQTRTLRVVYAPRPEDIDGDEITCRIADAVANLDDDLPCIGAFSLQATFEAGL